MAPNSTPMKTNGKAKKHLSLSQRKAQTPQHPKNKSVKTLQKTPKSEPPAKRKKLAEELDDQISDEEFETLLNTVKATEKQKKLSGKVTPKKNVPSSEDEDESDDEDFELDDDEDESDVELDSDEEDEDDEDDDEDEELDSSEMSRILKKLTGKDNPADSDSDEDDDDDDDEEEESEDEEDSDEEEAPVLVKGKATVQAKDKKTNKKEKGQGDAGRQAKDKNVKKKELQKKQEKSLNNKSQNKNVKAKNNSTETPAATSASKGHDDECTLFVKNLPKNITEKNLKKAFRDVTCVKFQEQEKSKIAYLEFSDEKTTNRNYELVKKHNFGSPNVVVDFVGKKSKKLKQSEPQGEIDPCKLYVRGFGHKMTEEVLAELFPGASEITLPIARSKRSSGPRPRGYAFIHFQKEKESKEALKECNGKLVQGKRLTVVPGLKKKAPKRPADGKDSQTAKKKKVQEEKLKAEAAAAAIDSEDDDDEEGDSEEDEDMDFDDDDDDDDDDVDDDDDDDDDDDE